MVDQKTLERMRSFRLTMMDPRKRERLEKNPQIKELLSRHRLDKALNDKRFVDAVEEGHFDQLRKNEQIEKLMEDDELTNLLANLDEAPVASGNQKEN